MRKWRKKDYSFEKLRSEKINTDRTEIQESNWIERFVFRDSCRIGFFEIVAGRCVEGIKDAKERSTVGWRAPQKRSEHREEEHSVGRKDGEDV